MVKLGIVVFGNNGGLGNQTRRLTYMLKPYRVLLIDARGFSKNKQHNESWYDNFQGYKVDGFPTNREINVFLKGLTHVLVCENPLNFFLFSRAKQLGIKTYCQSNYEFCDNLQKPELPLPDMFLMPSFWHIDTMSAKYGDEKVTHLPPPTDPNEFAEAREINFNRTGKKRFIHIVGTLAVHDRNGTLDILESLKHTKSDFELVIRSQRELPEEYVVSDPRVRYIIENAEEPQDLYMNFDAVILPRRYGGLSLCTNEGMMSGLPIIMTDISPNNQLLPKKWLIKAEKKGDFFTRTTIDIYGVKPKHLAKKIDWLVKQDLEAMKTEAFEIAHKSFSPDSLREKYEEVFNA